MMRQLMLLAVCTTSVSCTQSGVEPASQQPEAVETSQQSPSGEPEPKNHELYTEMESVLELVDEESANLMTAIQARDKVHSTWMSEKGAKLTQLEGKIAEAAKNRDLSGVKAIIAQAKPLRGELRNLLDAHQKAIHAALSLENQVEWSTHLLAQRLLTLMEGLELSDEQAREINAQALLAVQASTGESNPEAAGFLQLEKSVESNVLSDVQRQAYGTIKKKNPLRSLK